LQNYKGYALPVTLLLSILLCYVETLRNLGAWFIVSEILKMLNKRIAISN